MVAYLKGIWQCRYFWANLVKIDLRTRYRRSVLGLGWSLLHPIAMTIILCVVFHKIIMPTGNALDYAPFLLAGLASWTFFLTSTIQGCQCFFLGEQYIRQYPAPMAIYPLRSSLGAMIHFCIGMAVVLCGVWILNAGGWFHDGTVGIRLLSLLWLIPNVLLLFVFGWSMAVLAGVATVYFQDTQHLCEVGFQGLMYLTPILYPPEILRDRGMGWVVDYNPLAAMIELVRKPILEGTMPSSWSYLMASWSTVALFAAASVTLARCQKRIIFQL